MKRKLDLKQNVKNGINIGSITASKCKRAFIKATTSPTKAIKDIMGMNASVSTRFMKDGLASEPEIIQRKSVDFLYPKNILFLELPLMV